jgi:HPt (histidine-containing phosphotransfer) domain-containing protein
MIDDLSAAVVARDLEASGRLAHKLKGSAGSVGADEMASISHAAEAGLRSSAWSAVERSVAELRPAFVRVGEAIVAIGG